MSFYGQGAGRYPTAAHVVQDCLDILAGVRDFYSKEAAPAPVDNTIATYRYYIRTTTGKRVKVAVEHWGNAVVTAPMTVAELQKIYQEFKAEDEQIFVAAIG